jgi:hypothetical protein
MATKSFPDATGKTWSIWMQEMAGSCAAASANMAVALWKGQSLKGGEGPFIAEMTKTGSSYTDFLGGIGNKSMDQIGAMLAKMGARVSSNVAAPNVLLSIAQQASETRPAIMQVVWKQTGSGHIVVCVGKRGGLLTFLDPIYGLITIDPALFPNYALNRGVVNRAQSEGRLSGWYTAILG